MKIIIGDKNTIIKKFDAVTEEEVDFMERNNYAVKLTEMGFAAEWEDWIDYDESYAYIENNKLHIKVKGLPNYIKRSVVKEYYKEQFESNIIREYGEFFETEPGCPICVIVERDGVKYTV